MVAYSIGSYWAQRPVRERKSGIPLSVEMPAPVSTVTRVAASIIDRARARSSSVIKHP